MSLEPGAGVVIGALVFAVASTWAPPFASAWASPTTREIEQRGAVRCAMARVPGFSATDANGKSVGFMVDLCRALAAAVLGDADAIEIKRPIRTREFAAVDAGDVDVSFAQTTWTMTRDVANPVDFGPPVFHDTEALAAWRDGDGSSPLDGRAATACAASGSTALRVLEDRATRGGMPWIIKSLPTWTDVAQAFMSRECGVAAVDRAVMLTTFAGLPGLGDTVVIVDEPGTRQPIAPMVSNRDRDWLTVVRWTMFALVLAEAKGVTSANASERRDDRDDGEVRRLLNGTPAAAEALGLRPDWAFQVIAQIGNYGEIFERHLGPDTPHDLPRGPNRPWSDGGLMFVPAWQ